MWQIVAPAPPDFIEFRSRQYDKSITPDNLSASFLLVPAEFFFSNNASGSYGRQNE
jgi:hypothetical protein